MHFIQIGNWIFDTQAQQLNRAQQTIQLEPICSSLLYYLCLNCERIITRDDLICHVWNNRVVSDSAINRVISMLRKHLGDDPQKPSYIRTVHKQGYLLLASITELSEQEIENNKLRASRVNKKYFSPQNAVILVLIFGVVWLLLQSIVERKNSIAVGEQYAMDPLISKKGQQGNIVLSHNDKWLIFSHKIKGSLFSNLYIKNLHSGKINRLTDGEFDDMGASFSFDDSEIYFARIVRGKSCKIMHIDLVGFSDHKEKEIVTCNDRLPYNKVSVLKNNQELVFRDFQEPRGSGLYRYHLTNKSYQLATNIEFQPVLDWYQTVSPDGKYLAILRSVNTITQVLVKNLNDDSAETLLWSNLAKGIESISWSHDSQSIYLKDNSLNQLVNVNIINGDTKTMSLNSQLLSSFSDQNTNGEIYAVYGLKSQQDLVTISLIGEPEEKIAIDSSANDINGIQVSKEQLFFVSDRSGINQFYIQGHDEIALQLSDFKVDNSFNHFDIHPNGQIIIGMANLRLFSFDIKERILTWLSTENSDMSAPFFNDRGDIFYLIDNKYQWNLYQFKNEEHDELLLEDVGTGQWLKNEQGEEYLLYQKMNGVVYRHNFVTKETQQETYGLPHPGAVNRMWLATEQGIYFLRSGNYTRRGIYFKPYGKMRAKRLYLTEPFAINSIFYDKFNLRIIVEKQDSDLLTKVVKINLSAE